MATDAETRDDRATTKPATLAGTTQSDTAATPPNTAAP